MNNPEMNTEEHYKKYELMINKISWTFVKSTGLPFEDFKSEGNMIYMESINKFDKNKDCEFSTYLYSRLITKLKNIHRKKRQGINAFIIKNREVARNRPVVIHPETLTINKLMFKSLSENTKEIINIVFNAPNDLIEMLPKKTISMHQLRQYLTKKKGWTQSRCNTSFKEIKLFLNNL